MPRKGEGKRRDLLKDKDVERWFNNLARGSRATADNYVRVLSRFLEAHDLTPKSFLSMKTKDRDNLLSDFIDQLIAQKKAGTYIDVYRKVVISWLSWNGKKLEKKIKVPGTNRRPRLEGAHIPSQDELKRVLNIADARTKTAIAFMAFAGLREEVLGSYQGDDGLRLRDLPEVKIKDEAISIEPIPTRVVVPERLSKTGHNYFTFLGTEGCDYLSAYLQERKALGEHITLDSPIIVPRGYRTKHFIVTINIGDLIRKPMRRAGLKEPPYIWRSYFDSRAMLAESKGLLRDYRQFFMGHKGDIEHVYALHKQLPPDTIEAMRKAYEAALEFLETTPRASKGDSTVRLMSLLLQSTGHSEEDIADMKLGEKSDAELAELLKECMRSNNGNGKRQQIVILQDLDGALREGWEFKTTLPDGRVIIETDRRSGV